MMNFIVGFVIVAIIAAAVIYLVKQKKKGVACVGCPYSGTKNCHCDNLSNHSS